jgi:hypothetical protein
MGNKESKSSKYIFLCAYKYDAGSLPFLLVKDIVNLIMDNVTLINHNTWKQLKGSSAYQLNKNTATFVDNRRPACVRTAFMKMKDKPVWTIFKDSKDTSGWFQIGCIVGSSKEEIRNNINSKCNFKEIAKMVGVWIYKNFEFCEEQLEIIVDPCKKRFIINGKICSFQRLYSIEIELVCLIVLSNNKVPLGSSIIIRDLS